MEIDAPRRDPYPAHLDLRRNHVVILWMGSAGPLGYYGMIFSLITHEPMLWLSIAGSAVVVLSIGLWYAREWARVASGLIAAACSVWTIRVAYELATTNWINEAQAQLSIAGGLGFIAWYGLRPSMKRRFAAARESMARFRSIGSSGERS